MVRMRTPPYTHENPKIKGISVYNASWRCFMAGESCLGFASALSRTVTLPRERSVRWEILSQRGDNGTFFPDSLPVK